MIHLTTHTLLLMFKLFGYFNSFCSFCNTTIHFALYHSLCCNTDGIPNISFTRKSYAQKPRLESYAMEGSCKSNFQRKTFHTSTLSAVNIY